MEDSEEKSPLELLRADFKDIKSHISALEESFKDHDKFAHERLEDDKDADKDDKKEEEKKKREKEKDDKDADKDDKKEHDKKLSGGMSEEELNKFLSGR